MKNKTLQTNKALQAILLVLLLCVIGMGKTHAMFSFYADCPSGQRLYYYISDATNHYVDVTCPGLAPNFGWHGYMEPTGDLVIPESVEHEGVTYTVVAIQFSTFSNCHNLISVSIPNTVSYIGNATFYNCSGLTSVNIPDAVTRIGMDLFAGCTSLISIAIPNSVTSIEEYAFEHCTSLTSIDIPKSVTSIGDFTFENCSNLTSVHIGNSLTSIGNSVFKGCCSLAAITIPNSVTSISDFAFEDCSSLTSVIISEGVTSIGWNAFAQCTSLTSIASLATTPPYLYPSVFEGVPYTTLIVPCESKEAYDLSAWADYFSDIEEDCGTHEVIVDESNINGGNVSASASSAALGEEIQITITPEEDMALASLTVCNAIDPEQMVPIFPIGESHLAYGFIMPPFDVEISATFSPIMLLSECNEIAASAYPNPTNGQVRIEANNLKQISISNMLGQQIYEDKAGCNEFSYDFGKHETGVYLIRIETTKGVTTKRVVVL